MSRNLNTWDVFWTNQVEMRQSGRRVVSAIRSLVHDRRLQPECARVLHESLLVPVLTHGSEIMIWKEKERYMIWAMQMDNLRGLLGIRRMDKVQNARIRRLCGVTKGVNQKIDEGILRWFGYVKRIENDRIAKKVYVGKCAGSHSMGMPMRR